MQPAAPVVTDLYVSILYPPAVFKAVHKVHVCLTKWTIYEQLHCNKISFQVNNVMLYQ